MFVITKIRYTGVLFYTFHCNFGAAEKYGSLYGSGISLYRSSLNRRLHYIGVRYIGDLVIWGSLHRGNLKNLTVATLK